MNAPAASSSSTTSSHRFPWKWKLSDLDRVKKNGLTVFSCFACGGGSSMGYKLAGYTVLGNCEIDPKIAATYRANLHPRYSFVMDVRDFLKLPDEKIPQELFSLDVLDGSPPCSTFSMAGDRESAWGKRKRFTEGQALQTLDDLFFTFIAIAKRLRPKVVVAENVKGLILGNAKGYVHEIAKGFREAGYDVQLFLLNAASMGVPQQRERTFFVARQRDFDFPSLSLSFREQPIPFGAIRDKSGRPFKIGGGKLEWLLHRRKPSDKSISDICSRIGIKRVGFTRRIVRDDVVAPTVVAGDYDFRFCDGLYMTDNDLRNASTFPQDYDFGEKGALFLCGMSVPPVMMAQVASQIAEQWFIGD